MYSLGLDSGTKGSAFLRTAGCALEDSAGRRVEWGRELTWMFLVQQAWWRRLVAGQWSLGDWDSMQFRASGYAPEHWLGSRRWGI